MCKLELHYLQDRNVQMRRDMQAAGLQSVAMATKACNMAAAVARQMNWLQPSAGHRGAPPVNLAQPKQLLYPGNLAVRAIFTAHKLRVPPQEAARLHAGICQRDACAGVHMQRGVLLQAEQAQREGRGARAAALRAEAELRAAEQLRAGRAALCAAGRHAGSGHSMQGDKHTYWCTA